ncbi:cathepsin L-like isoform X6 [Penaeus japonicus]|uniref:cathepsin L-like isoform X6 n=1 Tax=Penaeus japonicus TaxID=27405 RepID=UPI001C70BA3C|nr:cathepsin L-like isoform X6 [Penaeus japonicus]
MRLILVVCALSSAWVVDAQLLRYEGKILLGSDGHDQKPHGQKLLGVDGHDQRLHSQALLGADGHDLRSHGQKHFGVDGHDQQPHGQMLLGADGHDQRPHHQTLLGADGHDQHPHTQTVLGGDGHDQRSHGQTLLGEDGHDQRNHKETLLGGDGHDQGHHGQTLLGADGHDMRAHSQKLLGQDGHDQRPHSQVLLGGDGHDQQPHGQKVGNGPRELSHTHMFKGFMKKYNKAYNSQSEFKKRFSIFRQNLKKIHILQQSERGTAKYGPTKFSDLTEHEFRRMLGLRPDLKPTLSQMEPAEIPSEEIPSSFDWRDHGIVTPVKNQGMCGSCWAFSVTGNVEGQWALKHKHLYSLSEQELVDCDKTDEGCNGGMPENAYEAIAKLGGLETENDYPYEAKDDQCHFNETKVKVTVNGSVELPQNEDDLARWLVKHGPISIGINANALQFYVGGVSHPLRFLCNPKSLDHGMLIVGYGVHTTKYLHRRQPYWIVKNSWGPDWGEQGYYRVYRGDGTCGVNQMATSAIVP